MKRVLIITTVGLDFEGITSVIYNYTNAMDKSDLQIDFLTFGNMKSELRDRFEKIGNILFVSHRKKDVFMYIRDLKSVLKEKRYDVVHIHGNSGTMLIEVLLSKISRVKKVLIHCHSTSTSHPFANLLMKLPMNLLSDVRIACSHEAGAWLYGGLEYIVLNNAIEVNLFRYNADVRDECRRKLEVNERFLIGHVGNFYEVKNHSFLIDVFYEFHKIYSDSALILLSDGPNLESIKQKVSNLGLSKSVFFMGRCSDVYCWYQAMDVFLLPSLWEGFPVVTLEGQASGLPMLISDTITKDVKVTDCVKQIPLSNINRWIEEIMRIKQSDRGEYRDDISSKNQLLIAERGYDISVEANRLLQIYMTD